MSHVAAPRVPPANLRRPAGTPLNLDRHFPVSLPDKLPRQVKKYISKPFDMNPYDDPKDARGTSHAFGRLLDRNNRALWARYGPMAFDRKHLGIGNAFTHAGTALQLSRLVGWPAANLAGLAYELLTGGAAALKGKNTLFTKETAMDLQNNFMGSIAGAKGQTLQEQYDILDYMMKSGWLKTIEPLRNPRRKIR